ncbi:MAG: acyl-CoA thioesterase [Steroidobacteraceae bacterium]
MRKLGQLSQTSEVVVAFHDVDVMAVVWHGHYLKYLENARWALMDRLGYGYEVMVASGYLWPIIEAHVRYIRPARFGDRLDVVASLVEWHNRLAINYLISDRATCTRVARARTVQAAVERVTGELQFTSPAPFVRQVESRLAAAASARMKKTAGDRGADGRSAR